MRRKLEGWGICQPASLLSECDSRCKDDHEDDSDDEEQRNFDRNLIFFIVLGVFGVCVLAVGVAIELMSVLKVGEEIDPTVNY